MPQVGSFLLVFAIAYGGISSSGIFKKNGINIVLAFVFAAFAAAFEPFVSAVEQYLPIIAIIMVVVFFLVLVKKVLSGDKGGSEPAAIALTILLILLAVLWDSISNFLPAGVNQETAIWGLGIVAVLLIFIIAYVHGKGSE